LVALGWLVALSWLVALVAFDLFGEKYNSSCTFIVFLLSFPLGQMTNVK
jgi:hypothetical protein